MISGLRIATDRTGTAAVEFALIMPLFAALFFGSFEVAGLLLADMKLTAAAQAAADLASTVSSGAGAREITNAAAQIMSSPGNASQLKIAYARVSYGAGTPVIDWHEETNGAAAIAPTMIPAALGEGTLAASAGGSPTRVLVVRADYAYSSPIAYVLARTWNLSEYAFLRSD